jgi:hypothetical protein
MAFNPTAPTLHTSELSVEANVAELMSPIQKAMTDVGITPEMLANQLLAELEATETKFFSNKGFVTATRNVVDWGTRQRARMDAHKLRGDYAPEQHEMFFGLTDGRYTEEEQETLIEVANMLARKKLEQMGKDVETIDITSMQMAELASGSGDVAREELKFMNVGVDADTPIHTEADKIAREEVWLTPMPITLTDPEDMLTTFESTPTPTGDPTDI